MSYSSFGAVDVTASFGIFNTVVQNVKEEEEIFSGDGISTGSGIIFDIIRGNSVNMSNVTVENLKLECKEFFEKENFNKKFLTIWRIWEAIFLFLIFVKKIFLLGIFPGWMKNFSCAKKNFFEFIVCSKKEFFPKEIFFKRFFFWVFNLLSRSGIIPMDSSSRELTRHSNLQHICFFHKHLYHRQFKSQLASFEYCRNHLGKYYPEKYLL